MWLPWFKAEAPVSCKAVSGAYLRKIAPMVSTEIGPLSKHLTPFFYITDGGASLTRGLAWS